MEVINNTMTLSLDDNPELQTYHEEILNTLSHILGLLLCLPAVFFLISVARMRGTRLHVISCTIYGLSLMTMYFCSSLYHSVGIFIHLEQYRSQLKDLDHCAIYMLIAGTYTPLTLINLVHNNSNKEITTPKAVKIGWLMFVVVWMMAAVGVLSKMILGANHIPDFFSNATYLIMGWVSLLGVKDLIQHLPRKGLKLLISGGLAYTSGIAFLIWETTPFNHAIWHLFVGAGSILHYFCILECIIPSRKDGHASVIIDNFDFAEQQLSLVFFGSRGRRQKFIVRYMKTLYRLLIGWAFGASTVISSPQPVNKKTK
ncbi:hypothetical protein SAMD00019534_006940, partial [Acytostelium subglobosum LB1]|uniref:hypothetical protein n=1 Tax=Acytostelium subglobosum LB1 TaxID=1410327 RepID=UPI000644A5E5